MLKCNIMYVLFSEKWKQMNINDIVVFRNGGSIYAFYKAAIHRLHLQMYEY